MVDHDDTAERQVAHFWIGHCDSGARLGVLLSEARYWALEDEDRDNACLSEFGETQQMRWYDHDFLEAGFETKGSTLAERFRAYSWSEAWAAELERRARELGLTDPNSFIMLGGSPDRPGDWDRCVPSPVSRAGANLVYAGKIEFTIS